MNTITLGPHASDFIWASGIENTFVPQIRGGYRALDEYELMGHYEHWREDLALGAELGRPSAGAYRGIGSSRRRGSSIGRGRIR